MPVEYTRYKQAHIPEIKDPITSRFAHAVSPAVEGGMMTLNGDYRFHRVGDLLVAAVDHLPPANITPVLAVFGQDTSEGNLSVISGIQLVVHDIDGVRHDKPGKVNELTKKTLKNWVEEDYVEYRLDDFLGMGTEMLTGLTSTSVLEDDPILLFKAIIDDDYEAVSEIREGLRFGQEMRDAGHNDADPENVAKVAEGLEVIVFQGRWGKKRREARAEELFREGLGLTG